MRLSATIYSRRVHSIHMYVHMYVQSPNRRDRAFIANVLHFVQPEKERERERESFSRRKYMYMIVPCSTVTPLFWRTDPRFHQTSSKVARNYVIFSARSRKFTSAIVRHFLFLFLSISFPPLRGHIVPVSQRSRKDVVDAIRSFQIRERERERENVIWE